MNACWYFFSPPLSAGSVAQRQLCSKQGFISKTGGWGPAGRTQLASEPACLASGCLSLSFVYTPLSSFLACCVDMLRSMLGTPSGPPPTHTCVSLCRSEIPRGGLRCHRRGMSLHDCFSLFLSFFLLYYFVCSPLYSILGTPASSRITTESRRKLILSQLSISPSQALRRPESAS